MHIGVGIDFIGAGSGTQSVPLGKIAIYDPSNTFFSNLTTAAEYVQGFTTAELTNQSFENNVFYFTVIAETEFLELNGFLLAQPADGFFHDPLGLITRFADQAFRQSEGNNILADVRFNDGAFQESTGDNILGDCTFNDDAFITSTGNNKLGNCNFNNYAFSGSTGNNNLGNCGFASNAFYESTGNNILGNCDSASNTFYLSTGDNVLGNCTFNNNAFAYATGNNYMKTCSFNHDAFLSAKPTIKNSVERLAFCQLNFAADYIGRFDILSAFGSLATGSQELPVDIFTSTKLCWIHAPEMMKYNNAGGVDGDLAQALTNLTHANKTVIYT